MSKKTFTQWLKGKTPFTVVLSYLLIIPGIILLALGGIKVPQALNAEPVKFGPDTPHRSYCYMDVLYMTELFAEEEENGRVTAEYCYAADEDFNWVCLEIKSDEYAKFAEIVEWTYDFEDDTAPETIRIEGSLYDMESELFDIAEEYYAECVAADASDTPSRLYMRYGQNSGFMDALMFCLFGVICLISSVIFKNRDGKRIKNANKTISTLKKSGQLDAAIADLGSENVLMGHLTTEKSGGNVMGDKYVFLFSSGKVFSYDEINCMSILNHGALRILRLHNELGDAYSFFAEPANLAGSGASVIDNAIANIQKHNPDCKML